MRLNLRGGVGGGGEVFVCLFVLGGREMGLWK